MHTNLKVYSLSNLALLNSSDTCGTDTECLLKCGALSDLVTFAQVKKCKNTHGGVLLLIKLQAKARFDRHCHKFTFTSFIVLSGDAQYRHCANGKPGLVENKDMSMNI